MPPKIGINRKVGSANLGSLGGRNSWDDDPSIAEGVLDAEHGQAVVSNLEESVVGLRGLVLQLGEKFEGLERKFKEIGQNQGSDRNLGVGKDAGGVGDTPSEKNSKDNEAKDPIANGGSAKVKFLENQVDFLTKNLKLNESYFKQKLKGLKYELQKIIKLCENPLRDNTESLARTLTQTQTHTAPVTQTRLRSEFSPINETLNDADSFGYDAESRQPQATLPKMAAKNPTGNPIPKKNPDHAVKEYDSDVFQSVERGELPKNISFRTVMFRSISELLYKPDIEKSNIEKKVDMIFMDYLPKNFTKRHSAFAQSTSK